MSLDSSCVGLSIVSAGGYHCDGEYGEDAHRWRPFENRKHRS